MLDSMTLQEYFYSLSKSEREAYCDRAGTTFDYVRIHLIPLRGGAGKIPRPSLLKRLAAATCGRVSYQAVLMHFYGKNAEADQSFAVSKPIEINGSVSDRRKAERRSSNQRHHERREDERRVEDRRQDRDRETSA